MGVALDLDRVNEQLQGQSAEQILRWAVETFGERLAVQSSMQKTAGVLMHMISRIAPATEVVFVDTGVHFPETLEIRDEFIRRYGLNIKTYSPERTFDEQYADFRRHLYLFDHDKNPPGYHHCCELRKTVPFLNAVKGRFDAVVSGLTRDEGGARENIQYISLDPRFNGFKVHPLADWTEAMVESYTKDNDLPVHPLYEQGYRSIGCRPCTTPVQPGEHPRAGRWRHIREENPELAAQPLYCGINFGDRPAK